MFDKQMVADLVEFVPVQASLERFGEAFIQFEIEDFEPQTLGLADFIMTASETRAIRSSGARQQTDSFEGRRHSNIFSTPFSRENGPGLTGSGSLFLAECGFHPLARF